MGNTADGSASIYGTNALASQVTGGVALLANDTYKTDNSGPRNKVGYAYASPSGSNADVIQAHDTVSNALAHMFVKSIFKLDGAVSEANKKLIQYDPDLLASTDSSLGIVVLDVEIEHMVPSGGEDAMDFDNLSAFQLSNTNLDDIVTVVDGLSGATGGTDLFQVRRLTDRVSASEAATTLKAVRYVLSCAASRVDPTDLTMTTDTDVFAAGELTFPLKDDIATSNAVGSADGS